jgi:transketolase
MRRAFADTTFSIQRDNPEVFVLLGDIGVHSFQKSFAEFPDRTFNIGILEQSMMGVAAGLAIAGKIPVVHSIATFLVERAFEQIKVDFGYQRLRGNLVSVGASFDYGMLGSTHNCPADVPILFNIPDIEIVVPGTTEEFKKLYSENFDNQKCTYFRLSETENRISIPLSIGEAIKIQDGKDVTVIAIGPVLDLVLQGIRGYSAEVIYLNTIRPLSAEVFVNNCKSGRLVFVEPFYSGPLFQSVSGFLSGRNLRIAQVGISRRFPKNYGTSEEIGSELGLSIEMLRQSIDEVLHE